MQHAVYDEHVPIAVHPEHLEGFWIMSGQQRCLNLAVIDACYDLLREQSSKYLIDPARSHIPIVVHIVHDILYSVHFTKHTNEQFLLEL